MEPPQSVILYVRTADNVLLRFSDLETTRAWIEARRLTLDDEYLATDQTWRPLKRLFRMDLPLPAPRAEETERRPASLAKREPATPHQDPEQVPTVELFPDALVPRGPAPDALTVQHGRLEGPTRVSGSRDGPTTRPLPPPVSSPALSRMTDSDSSVFEPELWGSEPDARRLDAIRRLRRVIRVVVVAGVVCVGGAVAWFVSDRSSEVKEGSVVAQQAPAVPAPVTVSVTPPVTGPRSEALSPPVHKTSPFAPPPEPIQPMGVAHAGPPADETPAMPPAPAAPPVAPDPTAPEAPPAPPPVATPLRPDRPPPTAQGSPPGVARSSQDFTYDQHMAEGMRWISRDPKKAYAHFQAASQQRPGSVEPKVKMAECEYRQGRYREAAALFQQAMDKSPDYGPAIAGLARAYIRLGNTNDARILYMKYLDVNPSGSHAAEARAYLGR